MDSRLLDTYHLGAASNLQGMSIISVEDLYVVDSDRLTCYSPTDMSFSATSAPASVVDFDNDPPSSDTSMLSEIDRTLHFYLLFLFINNIALGPSDLITLDSFIPILKHLPGFDLDQNSYVSPTYIYFRYIAHFMSSI